MPIHPTSLQPSAAIARADDYVGLLTDALPAPCLGVLPFVADADDAPARLTLDPDWLATL